MSGSESDDSDWSIGWLERHDPEFENDSETDNSFAVLVRCYGRGCSEQAKNSSSHVLGAINYVEDDPSGKKTRVSSFTYIISFFHVALTRLFACRFHSFDCVCISSSLVDLYLLFGTHELIFSYFLLLRSYSACSFLVFIP